ncbi:cobalt ECF transporter T component CbiQ [Litoribrevibacter euphylliae]|uniref:Cobalt ECF transporter T component CbiQ n=1 Tax=Litoribrevibacter euphylliae TaxID=1834034 RepID=A0ABV7HHU0_9GAMM
MSDLTSLANASKAPWLDALDARGRLIACLLFALSVICIHQVSLLMWACGFSLCLLFASQLPAKQLLKRLLPFEGFILILTVFMPFSVSGGEATKVLGLLYASEVGIERAQQVFLRANAILMCSLVLLATLLPETLGHAMARLGIPHKLVHLFLMTVRYVSVLGQEYQRLRTAMRARAFTPGSNVHTWRSYGWLIGMLLVRSLERSERVLQAMKCRGYQGRFVVMDEKRWALMDTIFLSFVVSVCVLLLIANYGEKML